MRLRARRLRQRSAEVVNRDDIEGTVNTVLSQLAQKPADTQKDIYVWSDGRVSMQGGLEEESADARVISVFSPGERPTREAIRTSLLRGLESAKDAAADEATSASADARIE